MAVAVHNKNKKSPNLVTKALSRGKVKRVVASPAEAAKLSAALESSKTPTDALRKVAARPPRFNVIMD